MPPFILAVAVVALVGAGLAAHRGWRHRELRARLEREWGVPRAGDTLDESRASEAWEELKRTGDSDADIDDRTWEDLDLAGVIASIDRTHTGLGQQMFYHHLRSGARWSATPALERLTTRLQSEAALRTALGLPLAGAGRRLGEGFWKITRPNLILVRWWYWSFPVLAVSMLVAIILIPVEPRALLVILGLGAINMAIRAATTWQVPGILMPMRQIGPLLWMARRLSAILSADRELTAGVPEDLTRAKPLGRIARWVSRDPTVSGELVASLWEYINLMFLLDANALLLSARYLKHRGPELARVAAWVGRVDLALAVASLRDEPRAWCTPQWSDATTTRGVGLWHPLVPDPVTNDIELTAGAGIIITGANMSGKSTYLRTVGIAAVLARGIETCPAAAWEGQSFRVRSLIGRADDLAAGKSYYQVEADGVVSMLHDSQQSTPTLFLLDELLRGTNTIERLAAGEAVLRALLRGDGRASPHTVLVATHDGELVTMLQGLYTPCHFQETVSAGELSFDYRRRPGPASTRTAIALLEISGASSSLVSAARERAAQLDQQSRGTLY